MEVQAFQGGYGIDFYQQAAEAYEKAHPGVAITVEGDPHVWEKLRPRFVSGDPSDLAFPGWKMDHWALAEEEQLMPLDGASDAGTFWRIMLPLARPGVLVVAIFNAIGLWNEYSLAKVLISSEANTTLPLGLDRLTVVQHYQSDWGALFAALVLVMAPVLALYWPFRDRIAETMVAGAVK